MRKATATPALIRHWLSGILWALLIGLVTMPAVAVLSDKTGQIQGQAPTVTGSLQVLFPDGETVLTDNAILELNQIPDQFRISSSTASLVLQDADGDSGLSALVDTEQARLIWKHDGAELTPEQLAAPLGDNFSGQTLTLEVSAPVTVSSATGLPTTAEPRILTGSYTLKVAAMFTGVSVNGAAFDMDAGFPSTGFSQAIFTLDMNGNPDDYMWNSNQSGSVVVNNTGQVRLNSQPSGAVTITATPKSGGKPLSYTFNVNTWFVPGEPVKNEQADSACATKSMILPTVKQFTSGAGVRQVGSLFGEWGTMSFYNAGFTSPNPGGEFINAHWTSDIDTYNGRYYANLSTGGNARLGSLATLGLLSCIKK